MVVITYVSRSIENYVTLNFATNDDTVEKLSGYLNGLFEGHCDYQCAGPVALTDVSTKIEHYLM